MPEAADDPNRIPRSCPFCGQKFSFPSSFDDEHIRSWLETNHLGIHIPEMMTPPSDGGVRTGGRMCNRCERYALDPLLPSDPLHRKCYSVDCFCSCSRKETHAAARHRAP